MSEIDNPEDSIRRRTHGETPRNKRISVRVTDEELAALQQRAQGANLALASYLVQAGLADDRIGPLGVDNPTPEVKILRELSVISRDLAHRENADPEFINRIEETIVDLAAHIRRDTKRRRQPPRG